MIYFVDNTSNNVVTGNRIGTDADGNDDAAEANLIGGNLGAGVVLGGATGGREAADGGGRL